MNRIIVTVGTMIALASATAFAQTNTIQLRNGANTTTILPSASSTITVQIPALSTGTHYLLTSTTNPGSSGAAGSFITYGATSAQNTLDISATNYLFNVGYAATAVEQVALGGLITSTATGTDKNATALTLAATGTGTGTSTALYITNGRLTFTDSDDSHTTSFTTGNQSADIVYTLPQSDGTNGQVLSTNGSGTLTWTTATSVAAINDLTDAVKNIANFSNSMVLGTEVSTMTGASNNTAVGMAAMDAITSGDNNAVFGYDAAAVLSDGSENVIIGSGAGALLVSGSGNVMIGYQAGASETGSNKLYIDNSSSATPLVQGDFSANTLTFNGATTTTGNVTIAGTTTYSAPSSSKTVTATTSTGAGAPDIASFTNTYEKVTVTATTAAGYAQLQAGTEGQIVYVRFLFTADASNSTVTIVNSNNNNTAMVYDGTGADVIVAHMLYTGASEGWVVFSALEYDN